MTAADTGFLVATIAAALSLITLGLRHRSVAAIAALVACLAIAFDFGDRHWFTPQGPVETPISSENAALDVQTWQKGTPSPDLPRYFVNAQIANSGKATAYGMQHLGTAAYADGPVDVPVITSWFLSLKAQLKLLPPSQNTEIGCVT
jgi:hypothetical protein